MALFTNATNIRTTNIRTFTRSGGCTSGWENAASGAPFDPDCSPTVTTVRCDA
jgi:hypothetical protein